MIISQGNSKSNRWAVILAGGDGNRLRPLTRSIAGDDRPKQFCCILNNESLLSQTARRIGHAIPLDHTFISLTAAHQTFYEPEVASLARAHPVVQPANLGTTTAILYCLFRLAVVDSTAVVSFFPSDHYWSDDRKFMAYVESAFNAIQDEPDMIVLLGIEPDRVETGYGWVEPGSVISNRPIRRVRSFWEKPDAELAQRLMNRGFLWNSFVMVGRVSAFVRMIQAALPHLVAAFKSIEQSLTTSHETDAIRGLYGRVKPTDFSSQVLSTRPEDLSVLRVSGVGWSDLGDPDRVFSTLARISPVHPVQRRTSMSMDDVHPTLSLARVGI